jgi:chemotaxis protein methyltransferase CheR
MRIKDDDLQKFIKEMVGHDIDSTMAAQIAPRLEQLMTELGIHVREQLFSLARTDASVRDRVSDSVTIHTTYFFRERRHFEILQNQVEAHFRGDEVVKCLSLGCSTGEEAYSMAMVLEQERIKGTIRDYEIWACDLSASCIRIGTEGVYDALTAPTSDPFAQGCMDSCSDVSVRMSKEICGRVHFQRANLARMIQTMARMKHLFSAIFCRNVLLYYRQSHRERLQANMLPMLHPNGLLFLGMSEASFNSGLVAVEAGVYRMGRAQPVAPVSNALNPLACSPNSIKLQYDSEQIEFDAMLFGSSTGGCDVVQSLISGVKPNSPPLVILQHMNPLQAELFIKGLRSVLSSVVCLRIADDGCLPEPVVLEAGTVYLTDGSADLELKVIAGQLWIVTAPLNHHLPFHPSIDRAFLSAAQLQRRIFAAVLSGLGNDGADGLLALAERAQTIAVQLQASAAAPGMPSAAFQRVTGQGYPCAELLPGEIADRVSTSSIRRTAA